MMIQWFTLNTSPLARTDTQNLTHTWYLSILRLIYWAARNGHSKVSFQGNTVNIIEVTLRLKCTFPTFLSTITKAEGQTHFSAALPLSLSLSPTDPVSSEQCVRRGGKRKTGTAHAHFLWLWHLHHAGTDYRKTDFNCAFALCSDGNISIVARMEQSLLIQELIYRD